MRSAVVPSATSEAIGQRLARDIARQTGREAPQNTPPPAAAPLDNKSLLRALAGASQVTGAVDRVEHYLRQAANFEAQGDNASALSCVKLAVQFDPSRSDTKAWYDRLERTVAAADAEAQRARAKGEEKNGRFETAAQAWMRVCLGRPDDIEGNMGAARCLLEGKGDLRKARDYAQKAVDLGPHSLNAHLLLVRVFQAAGMRLNAVRELEVAAKLDPGNQLVKTLQRELK